MASLYISEFADLGFTSNGVIVGGNAAGWLDDQVVAIGATSTPSAAFNAQTSYVLLSTDAACSIAWTQPGASVNAATATNLFLPANMPPTPFAVLPGMKISAITNT